MENKKKKVAILSIDGGGIRGIIPGVILQCLEEKLQKKTKTNLFIGDFFDFIAGTSTGGILASIYLIPNIHNRAQHSAKDALGLYLKNGEDIFHSSIWDKVQRAKGLIDERYSSNSLEKHLAEFFKNITLKELIKPCLITSYEITSRKAHFFTKSKEDMCNFYMKDVARATSAAPSYFEPALIKSLHEQEFALVDGGVFANNPALCAYAEARKTQFKGKIANPSAKDMIIVSIGTGIVKEPYTYAEMKDAGEIEWLSPIIDILMSGNAETVDYQLSQMYCTLSGKDSKDYHRLEPILKEASPKMDLATKSNIRHLQQAGYSYVEECESQLNEIVDKISENFIHPCS